MKPCLYCGKDLKDQAVFCPYCGKTFGPVKAPQELMGDGPQAPRKAQPLKRFLARNFDYCFFGVLFSMTAALVAPDALKVPEAVLGLFIIFFWTCAEAFLLPTWGTTPGKWLCRIVVRDAQGRKLTYAAAAERSLSAWISGMGLGIPVASAVTQFFSYRRLTSQGATIWDDRLGLKVTHSKMGRFRLFLFVVFFAGYLGVLVVLNYF